MHVSRANLAIIYAVTDGNGRGKSDFDISTSPLTTRDAHMFWEKRNFERFQLGTIEYNLTVNRTIELEEKN